MPFTPAHIAAALPLSRVWPRLPLPALVLGTMAPDFEYLLRFAPHGEFAHSPLGLLVFCLPVALLGYVAFERIVRPSLVRLLPPGLGAACGGGRVRDLSGAALGSAALAVLLGALSHVAWDGLVHAPDWAVAWLPSLREPAGLSLMPGVRWFRLLEHGSSLVGGAVVVIWVGRWLWRQPPSVRAFAPGQAARSARTVAMLLLVAGLVGAGNAIRVQPSGLRRALSYAAVGAMNGLGVALLVYGVWAGRRRDGDPHSRQSRKSYVGIG